MLCESGQLKNDHDLASYAAHERVKLYVRACVGASLEADHIFPSLIIFLQPPFFLTSPIPTPLHSLLAGSRWLTVSQVSSLRRV